VLGQNEPVGRPAKVFFVKMKACAFGRSLRSVSGASELRVLQHRGKCATRMAPQAHLGGLLQYRPSVRALSSEASRKQQIWQLVRFSIYLVANHPVAGRGTDCGVQGADSGGRATPEYRIDEL